MNIEDVVRKIRQVGIIPVVRAATVDEASQAIEAIYAGGIPIVEITMTIPDAPAVIRRTVDQYGGEILTGAGTVLTPDEANACMDAGAEFLVSPGLSVSVLHAAHSRGKLAIPGALTPTELMHAVGEGARIVKIFPCGNVGGPKYLKALKGPFPQVALVPTGGVNASNAAAYLEAGAFALGIGADLVDLSALREGKVSQIVAAAKELVEIVRGARGFESHPD